MENPFANRRSLTSNLQRPTSSEGARLPAGWLRASLPIAWVQVGVLLGALCVLPLIRNVDPDFWWHVRTGDLIFHSGIPRHDPFSWTAAGHPWVAHEWLSEAVIYAVQTAFGYAGNALLFGAAVTATLLLMYALGRRAGAGTRPLVLMLYLSAFLFSLYVTVRPQEFSWLFFAVFVYVLHRHTLGERVRLWLLPPLMALWANLHLGFVYGLMLVGVWALALALERLRGRDVDLRVPPAVLAACVAAACLNPAGPLLLWYPARYAFGGAAPAWIREWQPASPLVPLYWPILLTCLLLGLAVLSHLRPPLFLSLVTVVVVAMSLQAVRNAAFAALLLPAVSGYVLAGWTWSSRARDARTRLRVTVAAPMYAALVAVLLAYGASVTGSLSLRSPNENGYPAAAASYVLAHYSGPDHRLFNDYVDGGYLIYRLYPQVHVFVDGRSDFYPRRVLDDYATVAQAHTGWDRLLDQNGVDVVMVRKTDPVAAALVSDPRWSLTFSDSREVVFARS